MNNEIYEQFFETVFGGYLVAKLREGTCDFNTIQAIVVEDEYNLKKIKFENGDTIVDVGTYLGALPLLLASLGRSLKIYAYEPIPENVELARINALGNGFKNIEIIEAAVGGDNESLEIHYGNPETESGKCHEFVGNQTDQEVGKGIKVKTVTLDDIFQINKIEHCKLLKLDPEGEEYKILLAASPETLQKIDYIVGEHHWVTRGELLKATKGLFDDVLCPWQTDGTLGHFWFRNKKLRSLEIKEEQTK